MEYPDLPKGFKYNPNPGWMEGKSCATCGHLGWFTCPGPHSWCNENELCPCNADESLNHDSYCELYVESED